LPIYTTYLGYLNKHKDASQRLGSCFVYYVMRNRGNDCVAPSEQLSLWYKRTKHWEAYERQYLNEIRTRMSALWFMKKVADESRIGNVLLICYEKDATRCHRRLLAEEIAKRFGVEYRGELP